MRKGFIELLILHFLNDGVRTVFLVMLPFIAKDLNLSLSISGLLGSSLALSTTLLAVPSGFAVAKLGGFKLLTTLLAIYSLGAIAIGFSPNLIILLVSFLLGALGFGMFHTVSFTIVGKSSDKTNIGKNMGNFTAIGDIGRSALPPASVFLAAILGWRPTMILIGAIGVFIYFIFSLNKNKSEVYNLEEKSKEENHMDFMKGIFSLLKIKGFLLTTLAGILDSLASSPLYVFLPFFFLYKGMTAQEMGILMAAFFVGSVGGKTLLGRLVDKRGHSKIFILAELLMALTLILIAFSSDFQILTILSFLVGSFTKGTSPVVQTMFSTHTHKGHYNKVYAISETCISFSAVISQILMGVMADKFGITMIFYISASLAVLAVLPILILKPSTKISIENLNAEPIQAS